MLDTSHRCVLVDRDGVINRRIVNGYVTRWKDFAFLPGVLAALRLLKENGYKALVVSNQSCVGRGLLSWQELQAITRRMRLEVALAVQQTNLTAVYAQVNTTLQELPLLENQISQQLASVK